jgi:hypothetical protein
MQVFVAQDASHVLDPTPQVGKESIVHKIDTQIRVDAYSRALLTHGRSGRHISLVLRASKKSQRVLSCLYAYHL